MSIWASWGDEDEVRAVQYREGFSNHYPSDREDEGARKLAQVLDHFINQPARTGGGE